MKTFKTHIYENLEFAFTTDTYAIRVLKYHLFLQMVLFVFSDPFLGISRHSCGVSAFFISRLIFGHKSAVFGEMAGFLYIHGGQSVK